LEKQGEGGGGGGRTGKERGRGPIPGESKGKGMVYRGGGGHRAERGYPLLLIQQEQTAELLGRKENKAWRRNAEKPNFGGSKRAGIARGSSLQKDKEREQKTMVMGDRLKKRAGGW